MHGANVLRGQMRAWGECVERADACMGRKHSWGDMTYKGVADYQCFIEVVVVVAEIDEAKSSCLMELL